MAFARLRVSKAAKSSEAGFEQLVAKDSEVGSEQLASSLSGVGSVGSEDKAADSLLPSGSKAGFEADPRVASNNISWVLAFRGRLKQIAKRMVQFLYTWIEK